jgi:glycosyltransferase involved in cell wall biosynthesis
VIAGGGRSAAAFVAAFRGAIDVLGERSDAMLFVDADAARRTGVWRLAREAHLLDRVSLIDAVEERRDLVVRNDILMYPDHRGEQRTLLLDAMGAGMYVIAHADPLVQCLIPDQTARVLHDPSAEIWAAELRRALDEQNATRALGMSARERIRSDYRASNHVRSVVDGYEWLTSADAMPFRDSAR